jgi:hypothetical protein
MEINFSETAVYTSYVVVYYQLITTLEVVTGKLWSAFVSGTAAVHRSASRV